MKGHTVLLHYFGTAFYSASAQCHWPLFLIKSAHFENLKYCLVKAQGHMERGHRYFPPLDFLKIYLFPDQTPPLSHFVVARMSGVYTAMTTVEREVVGSNSGR